ncbi:polysialyltransferase family glycosyltransferase [Sodalis sp. dw_96]|uniref:polysialyltransferase family glycosyltransferase n=1 Tax=Sodalis sp. dw_96 TaxID=2719794 RepID=UPI001BD285F0|nr:polysialyltransferase family glycosyltransferase [Sodalis sp. dw_96]
MKERLFVSTGYYSTLLAAALVMQSESGYRNHLLVTLDRQSREENTRWAYRMYPNWASVNVISHEEYYVDGIHFKPDVEEFYEVVTPFFEMLALIKDTFKSRHYNLYEEGLTSYSQFLKKGCEYKGIFYCLHPHLLNNVKNLLSVPIPASAVKFLLEKASQCYLCPSLRGNKNIIFIGHGGFPNENDNNLIAQEIHAMMSRMSFLGYKILMTKHTRIDSSVTFAENLYNDKSLNLEFIDVNIPLTDILLLKNIEKISFIFGVCSTLLINSELLHNIKAYSIDSALMGDRQNDLIKIQNSFVKNISEIAFP